MATKSKTTKKYAKLAVIFTLLSFLCVFAPALIYVGIGLATATLVVQKFALTATIAMVLVFTMVSAVTKWVFRSKIWLIILALFFVLDKFLVMVFVFAITQIADELIIAPLARHFRNKASINREIDKRLGE